MTEQSKPSRRQKAAALRITVILAVYVFGTLALCVYLSWWFAALYALPLIFISSLTLILNNDLEDERLERKRKPHKNLNNDRNDH